MAYKITPTTRHSVSKLELPSSDPVKTLSLVSANVYGISQDADHFSTNNNVWYETDDVFNRAKQSYDEILSAFNEPPLVYKFPITKERVVEARKKKAEKASSVPSVTGKKREFKKPAFMQSKALKKQPSVLYVEELNPPADTSAMTPEEQYEYEIQTLINPFDVPKPWVRRTRIEDGEVVFLNLETKQVKTFAPGEVWSEKMKLLEKLSLREDQSGWEYFEDESEKRKRMRLQIDFENKLKKELDRREANPTDEEQVEDALFWVVDTIVKADEREKFFIAQQEDAERRMNWHPATIAHVMSRLSNIGHTDEESSGIYRVTDYKYEDLIISAYGFIVAATRPFNLFANHAKERALVERMLQQQALENKKDKEYFVALFAENKKQAIEEFVIHVYSSVATTLLTSMVAISQADKRQIMNNSKTRIVAGAKSLLAALKNPSATAAATLATIKQKFHQLHLQIFPIPAEEAALQKMIAEYEEEDLKSTEAPKRRKAQQIEHIDMTPIPMVHPDVALITLTCSFSAPPLYVMRRKTTTSGRVLEIFSESIHKLQQKRNQGKVAELTLYEKYRLKFYKTKRTYADILAQEKRSLLKNNIGVKQEMYFDTSERSEFELILRQQLAVACCMEIQYISLEEVRNVSGVKDLVTKKKQAFEEHYIRLEQQRQRELEEAAAMMRRLEKAAHFHREGLTEEQRREELGMQLPDFNAVLTKISAELFKRKELKCDTEPEEQDSKDASPSRVEPEPVSLGTDVGPISHSERRASVKSDGAIDVLPEIRGNDDIVDNEAIAHIVSTGADTPQKPRKSSLKMPSTERPTTSPERRVSIREEDGSVSRPGSQGGSLRTERPDITNPDFEGSISTFSGNELPPRPGSTLSTSDNPQEANEVKELPSIDVSPITMPPAPPPSKPSPVKFGLQNPEERRYADNYWLAAELKTLTEAQRQQKRIVQLVHYRQTHKSRRDQLVEELILLREQHRLFVSVVMRYLKPLAAEFKEKLVKEVVPAMKRLAQRRKPDDAAAEEERMPDSVDGKKSEALLDVSEQVADVLVLPDTIKEDAPDHVSEDEKSEEPSSAPVTSRRASRVDIDGEAPIEGRRKSVSFVDDGDADKQKVELELNLSQMRRDSVGSRASSRGSSRRGSIEHRYSSSSDDESPTRRSSRRSSRRESVSSKDAEAFLNKIRTKRKKSKRHSKETVEAIEQLQEVHDAYQQEEAEILTVIETIDDGTRSVVKKCLDDMISILTENEVPVEDTSDLGCKVSFHVVVTPELKKQFHGLRSDDIAVLLHQQLYQPVSILNNQSYTKHIVDIHYKSDLFRKATFDTWEERWKHIIHPVYFNYTTKKCRRPVLKYSNPDNRLENGLLIRNPTELLSENAKNTLMQLPVPKMNLDLVDLNVDDIGKELDEKHLTIYRPNMSNLTKKDVEKCYRIHKIFAENYRKEMSYGLVDNARLRQSQFAALKLMQQSKRIYDVAKQKYNRVNRKDDLFVPTITRITDEQLHEWYSETQEEDIDRLKNKRLKVGLLRQQRIQLVALNQNYEKLKQWTFTTLLSYNPDIQTQLTQLYQIELQKEAERQAKNNSSTLSISERDAIALSLMTSKQQLIEEEKHSRKLYSYIEKWYHNPNSGNDSSTLDDMHAIAEGDDESTTSTTMTSENSLIHTTIIPLPHKAIIKYVTQIKTRYQLEQKIQRRMRRNSRRKEKMQTAERRKTQMALARQAATAITIKAPTPTAADLTIDSPDASVSSEISIPMHLLIFSDEELEFISTIKWFKLICDQMEYMSVLEQFPEAVETEMSVDELVSFAKIVFEVEPIFTATKAAYQKQRADKEASTGKKRRKKRGKESASTSPAPPPPPVTDIKLGAEDAMAAGLKKEAAKRAKALKKAAKRKIARENAYLTAHQHLYIKVPFRAAYCVICHEKKFLNNLETFDKDEATWKSDFDNTVSSTIESYEAVVKSDLEREHLREIEKQRLQRLHDIETEKKHKKQLSRYKAQFGGDVVECLFSIVDKIVTANVPIGSTITKLPTPMEYAKLSPTTPAGEKVGGSAVGSVGTAIVGGKVNVAMLDLSATVSTTPAALLPYFDDRPHEILILLWNYENDERGDSLGYVVIPTTLFSHPAKGSRVFNISGSSSLVKPGREHIVPKGAVTVKLVATKWSEGEEKRPIAWRLQLMKASRLFAIDKINKNNVYAEVYYKGDVSKYHKTEFEAEWQKIIVTDVVYNTADASFGDAAIYELPPQWTDSVVQRPVDGATSGGCYVPKNMLPPGDIGEGKAKQHVPILLQWKQQKSGKNSNQEEEDDFEDDIGAPRAKRDPRKAFKNAIKAVRLTNRMAQHTIQDLEAKVELRLSARKLLMEAEELERQCMAKEERRMRCHLFEAQQDVGKPYIEEQKFYERDFSRLLQLLQSPPRTLARVRFMMGTPMYVDNMWQDPATKEVINVISLPLLYDEDEEELNRHIMTLLGRPHPGLMRIIDYSVHQVRDYAFTGQAATDQRVAMIITQRSAGLTLLEYLQVNWGSIDDAAFKSILIAILNALAILHKDGLVHRNLHPDCVIVVTPTITDDSDSEPSAPPSPATTPAATPATTNRKRLNTMESAMSYATTNASYDSDGDEETDTFTRQNSIMTARTVMTKQSSVTAHKSVSVKQPVETKTHYILGDFWFLHNPRKSNCEYSEGRADWGCNITAPPEQGGYAITAKSDIYALGVCIYIWATKGKHLYNPNQNIDFDMVFKLLPLKWGPWLHSLLRMCLQKNPKFRASAEEIVQFLVLSK